VLTQQQEWPNTALTMSVTVDYKVNESKSCTGKAWGLKRQRKGGSRLAIQEWWSVSPSPGCGSQRTSTRSF
jgi:hypothetical protein